MEGVVMAGGEGTRLRPLTYSTPKPLLPIANQAFLERQLAWLAGHGVDDVVLSLGYLPDAFDAHFPDREFHGERTAVLALAHNDAADADDAALAGAQVTLQVAVVLFPVGGRHQQLDIMPADLFRVMNEIDLAQVLLALAELRVAGRWPGYDGVPRRCRGRQALSGRRGLTAGTVGRERT